MEARCNGGKRGVNEIIAGEKSLFNKNLSSYFAVRSLFGIYDADNTAADVKV